MEALGEPRQAEGNLAGHILTAPAVVPILFSMAWSRSRAKQRTEERRGLSGKTEVESRGERAERKQRGNFIAEGAREPPPKSGGTNARKSELPARESAKVQSGRAGAPSENRKK